MTFVVLRPYWNVPPGIFGRTVLPAIKKDRGYVAAKRFEVTTQDGKVVTSGEVSDDVLAQLQARQARRAAEAGARTIRWASSS